MNCAQDSGGLARAACEREANRSAAFQAAASSIDAYRSADPNARRAFEAVARRFRRGVPTIDDVAIAVGTLGEQALSWYGDPAKAQSRARAIRAIQYLKGVQV